MKTKASSMKAAVSERALIQRVNRKLRDVNEQLRRSRTEDGELGRYYIVDLSRSVVAHHHVHLDKLAQRLNVLAQWEQLSESK